MIDTILGGLYTPTVVEKMGDIYPHVYSWSAFALVVLYALMGFFAFAALLCFFGRWFK